jgi:Fe-S cluster assembly scaffold protein SufB
MDIHDMTPENAKRLTHHRYHESLRVLHQIIKDNKSPSVNFMETLEKLRQDETIAEDYFLASIGLAPSDPAQIEIQLDGAE